MDLKRNKNLWTCYYKEIIDSVIVTEQNVKCKKEKENEIQEKINREQKHQKITFFVGSAYVLSGVILLYYSEHENLLINEPQNFIGGLELIILGIYALLHTFLFQCIYGPLQGKHIIKTIFVICMIPYYFCINCAKKIVKITEQEHVIYLFPYYLISLFLVAISYTFIAQVILNCQLSRAFDESVTFFIVLVLVCEFFAIGKFFAYICTKSIIKSIQKNKIKKVSKKNWRSTWKDDNHREERRIEFENEWTKVQNQLEYTKIYFYMFLTIVVLCIPKTDNVISELFMNQFLGVTTIAALAREVKSRKESDEKMDT